MGSMRSIHAMCRSSRRGSGGNVTIVVSVEGENARRLERIATGRGEGIDQIVADLARNA